MSTSPVTTLTHFVGIDVAKEVHAACGIARDGTPWMSSQKIIHSLHDLQRFEGELRARVHPEHTLIGMEATGHYWIRIEAFLSQRGWQTTVINPVLTAVQARTNTRGRVTDTDDALTIAKIIRDGVMPSHILDAEHEELREMTRRRTALMERRVADIQCLQAQVDVMFPEFTEIMNRVDKLSSLAVLGEFPSADAIAVAPLARVIKLITTASLGRKSGNILAPALRRAAANSLAIGAANAGRERMVRQLVRSITHLDQELVALDKDILKVTKKPGFATEHVDRLPGFGPITTAAVVAEYGELERFVTVKANGVRHVDHAAMLAHAGLDPRICESGKWVGKAKMSKRGSPHLRRAIILAASFAIRQDDWCAGLYRRYHAKCSRRGHWFALSHVARHLIQALAASLKYRDDFTWERFIAGRKALTKAA
jgi:transposase